MYRLDRKAFKALSFKEAEIEMSNSKDVPVAERLRRSYYLIAAAYNFDPEHPPRLDRNYFEMRKRD